MNPRLHKYGSGLLSAVLAAIAASAAHAAAVPGQGTWETTLQPRDLDGNLATAEAYYDTVQNITWLGNAAAGGFNNYAGAAAWVSTLDPFGSGITGWRLPVAVDAGLDGCTYTNFYQGVDCGFSISVHSELSYLWYVTLGNLAYHDTSGGVQAGGGLTNTGPFTNVDLPGNSSAAYVTSTPNPAAYPWNPERFMFLIRGGQQGTGAEYESWRAWAVHAGDVGTPVPDTDADFIPNGADNCSAVANLSQCDSDGDGYGNHCDADLNNNGATNAFDTPLYRAQLGQPSVGPTYNIADLNCSGAVNAFDTPIFRSLLGSPPGPSGLVP